MTAKQPQLPVELQQVVDEARAAQSMEESLRGPLSLKDAMRDIRAKRAREEQKFRKANSYTLAEKYNLLDLFPPTVIVSETKPV
jgi:hypothetical protein